MSVYAIDWHCVVMTVVVTVIGRMAVRAPVGFVKTVRRMVVHQLRKSLPAESSDSKTGDTCLRCTHLLYAALLIGRECHDTSQNQ